MAAISQALRAQLAREYELAGCKGQLEAAAELAPRSKVADHARIALLPMLLPDLVAAIEGVICDAPDSAPVRGMAGGLLGYVCNPLDLIGDDSPLGRADDAIICALGLERLRELDGVSLDTATVAGCAMATSCLAQLSEELREGIMAFVADLERSTHADTGRRK